MPFRSTRPQEFRPQVKARITARLLEAARTGELDAIRETVPTSPDAEPASPDAEEAWPSPPADDSYYLYILVRVHPHSS